VFLLDAMFAGMEPSGDGDAPASFQNKLALGGDQDLADVVLLPPFSCHRGEGRRKRWWRSLCARAGV
jgi:hypothetical protein